MNRPIDNVNNLSRSQQRLIRTQLGVRNINGVVRAAREQGLDLSNSVPRQRRQALRYFANIHNEQPVVVNAERRRLWRSRMLSDARRIRRNVTRQEDRDVDRFVRRLTRSISNNGPDNLSFGIGNNRMGSRLMARIGNIPTGRRLVMRTGDKFITLNQDNLARYRNMFNNDQFYWGGEYEYVQQFVMNALNSGMIEFMELRNPDGPRRRGPAGGTWFKYRHKIGRGADLKDLQIYHIRDTLSVEDDCCFIHSLKQAGISTEKLNMMRSYVRKRNITLKSVKRICEIFNIHVTVRRIEDGSNLLRYGNREETQIQLGLIDDHYFHIRPTLFTSYCLDNYSQIVGLERFNEIRGFKDGRPRRSKDRFINSYDLVKSLLKNKDELLELIPQEELFGTHYFNTSSSIKNIDIFDWGEFQKPNIYYKKDDEDEYINVYFDFETRTNGTHQEYLVRADVFPNKCYTGEDCGKKMLLDLHYWKPRNHFRLIACNAAYDLRFLLKYLSRPNLLERGKMLLRGHACFYYNATSSYDVIIQCAYALIPMPLRDYGKSFDLPVHKEIIPYNLYNVEGNIEKRYLSREECIEGVKKQYKSMFIGKVQTELDKFCGVHAYINLFEDNCRNWNCINENGDIDIIEYSSRYCQMDCEVLKQGYVKFKEWIGLICGLNIDNYVSLPQLANDYLKKEKVYDKVYMVSGVVREFCYGAMVGGRTMLRNNEMYDTNEFEDRFKGVLLNDLDAVSLYASAMIRLGGFCKGVAKVIPDLDWCVLKDLDLYIVEIQIFNIPKKYPFSLLSKKGENGVRCFDDKVDYDEYVTIDKIALEDLINFCEMKPDIDFKVIRGYYWNKGRNNRLGVVIQHLVDVRKEQKALGNPIQLVYKLLSNSAYGKTLLKPIEYDTTYLNAPPVDDNGDPLEFTEFADRFKNKGTTDKLNNYVMKNYNEIYNITPLPNKRDFKIKKYKAIDTHYNSCHCGIEVLSMSKRIMNEVLCLAHNIGVMVYYQDTDSMHIENDKIPLLEKAFYDKYNRELVGTDVGQFHCDFDSKICKGNLVSIRSIGLGKKCYIDVLKGDKSGDAIDYHIRMKGISLDAILYYCEQNKINPEQLYEKLYDGEEITFDLLCGGSRVNFEFMDNMEVRSKMDFTRRIKFN